MLVFPRRPSRHQVRTRDHYLGLPRTRRPLCVSRHFISFLPAASSRLARPEQPTQTLRTSPSPPQPEACLRWSRHRTYVPCRSLRHRPAPWLRSTRLNNRSLCTTLPPVPPETPPLSTRARSRCLHGPSVRGERVRRRSLLYKYLYRNLNLFKTPPEVPSPLLS